MSLEFYRSLDSSELEYRSQFHIDCKGKLPTFVSDNLRPVERQRRKNINNVNEVLDLLNAKFNLFRKGFQNDSPNEAVGSVVKRTLHVDTFLDFIHSTEHPAIITPPSPTEQGRNQITHRDIRTFIGKSFNLAQFNLWRGDRVAICLPEGPVLNLCLLSTMAYCTCVPSNFKLTPDELINDYRHLKVKAVIVPYDKLITNKNDALTIRLREAGLQLIGLKTTSDSDIRFTLAEDPINVENNNTEITVKITGTPPLNETNDIVMLIQTSGTTGQKKIVPYRLQTLCISTVCVIFSLDARDTDTIINMMPLFHVGGIIRNLLTPIFSGGSIIQCKGFDPVLFCDILESQTKPIWFYGVPSMQQNIIQVATMRKLPSKCCDLVTKICNAGAGLAPALAKEIKSVFTQAVILPSYGMTECMPICAPPIDYALELDGTSGQVIGPELAISVDNEIVHSDNITGHIMVRCGPCFDGYEGVDNSETFDENGFFDTGDMGYLNNGYVYITGRSKEVINRGGETLSPLEIENVLIGHPKIAQVMAFSVPHDTLQETVGCAIVTRDQHLRPNLRSIRSFLDQKLHSSKHPQLIVYMNEIPKSNVGKVMRINFSNRLNIPCITKTMELTPSQLLYEAHCTTSGPTFDVVCSTVKWSVSDVVEAVKKYPKVKACTGYRNGENFTLFIVNMLDDVDDELVPNVKNFLRSKLHDYMLPTDVVVVREQVLKNWDSVDEKSLANLLKSQQEEINDPVTLVLCDLFGLAIGIRQNENGTKFPADGSFFDNGGDSLKAGFLISLIRTKLGVTIPVTTLYEVDSQTPAGLAAKCRDGMAKDHFLLTNGYDEFRKKEGDAGSKQTFENSNYKKRMESRPKSSSKNPFNPLIMLFQASPFYLMQPLAQILQWILFVHILLFLGSVHRKCLDISLPNVLWLLSSLVITKVCMSIILPLFGILMKWLVIGRYRSGTYPLWGGYYLRWWFVNKLLLITDTGIFKLNPQLYIWYLRLMGAKIGRNTRISCDAKIGEYDLISVGSNCFIDDCIIKPFRLSCGHMNLSNIVIGDSCAIGFQSNIVSGTTLSNETNVGPQTTTYTRHMKAGGSSAHKDTATGIELGNLCRETFPQLHILLECFVGWPIVILSQILAHIPWFYCLYLLTESRSFSSSPNVTDLILYLTLPARIGYFLLAVMVRRYVVHLLYIILVILIKRLIIGKFEAGPRKLDQMSLLRYWLMKTLLDKEKWQLVSTIVGSHYEGISIIYRLLGAKIGKRVYWPGTNIHVIEYDLLTVGNDVIFGSRSHILCSDASESAPVTIDDGAMSADGCVILPGARIGRNAILGSGGLLKKHFYLADDSIWYGSFNGNAVKLRDGTIQRKCASTIDEGKKDKAMGGSTSTTISMSTNNDDNDTKRPYGRAFCDRKANYFVFPLALIIFYSCVILCIGTVLWCVPMLAALQVTAFYIRSAEVSEFGANQPIAWHLILVLFSSFSLLYTVLTTSMLCLEVISKWALLGKREAGSFNWDTSSYCQRWQILILVQHIARKHSLDLMGGSPWIILFFRALGCRIGKRVCLFPNGGDPVMTEPELVVLEDDVAVDRAALVCHLNTFGEFSINPLWVGAGSVLQNNSRLAPGARMLEDCTLMDRSYIIQGEIAEAGSVWQGYPAVSTSFEEQYALYSGNRA
ncbi:uncharacterized protein LOC119072448 [Bradysia coprophila]|uniref:uncharacterized protein LOC119072448 n=1 Tax=Bradysia coprophila TaxID=38358 RepID=UPI00187DC519|nr:uncharacterized protein LOC119072448 [Bradysia coprophila]